MSLKIGVLGEPFVGGIPSHVLLAGDATREGDPVGPEFRDKDGRIWSLFDRLPAEEMLDYLDQCHALVILPPTDSLSCKSPADPLVRDLLAFRRHRGKNALPAGLPVVLIQDGPKALEVVSQTGDEKALFCAEFSRGFGGIGLVELFVPGKADNQAEIFAKIGREVISQATKYRKNSWWGAVQLWVTVLFLAAFSLSLLAGVFFLALNSEIPLVLQYRQLKYGLAENNPFFLKAEKIGALEERLSAIEEFLDRNQGISESRGLALNECRERLRHFVRKIRESENWPLARDIHDLPTLRQVVDSVGKWDPGSQFHKGYPLVEEVYVKKERLATQLFRAEELQDLLGNMQTRGEKLLRANPSTQADFKNWLRDCEKYFEEMGKINQVSQMWSLDELSEAKEGCLQLQEKIGDIVQLVVGFGMADTPGAARGTFFPGKGLFEEEIGEALLKLQLCRKIWNLGDTRLGGDPQLLGAIRTQARLAKEAWLKGGKARLAPEIQGLRKNRAGLEDWIGKNSREPVWQKWSELVAKLAVIANVDLAGTAVNAAQDPWMECSTFLQGKNFRIRPARVEIHGLPGLFGSDPGDWTIGIKTDQNGEELILKGDKIESRGKVEVLVLKGSGRSSIRWDWTSPLAVQLRSRSDGGKSYAWIASSPLERARLIGEGNLKLFWFPEDSMPEIPFLLAP